jgi:hypothetical protein
MFQTNDSIICLKHQYILALHKSIVFFSRLVIPLKIPSYPFAARCPIFCMGHMMDKKTGCERHMTDK